MARAAFRTGGARGSKMRGEFVPDGVSGALAAGARQQPLLDSSYDLFANGLTLDDALDRFEASKAYIAIYNPERDAVYQPLLESLLAEIATAIREFDPDITWYSTYIFMSTRDSLTPYHMDREMNFLLQVHGEKKVFLWDPNDDAIMSAADKDRLLSFVESRRPLYSPAFESKAQSDDLRAGSGCTTPSSRRTACTPAARCRCRWRSPSARATPTPAPGPMPSTTCCGAAACRPGDRPRPGGRPHQGSRRQRRPPAHRLTAPHHARHAHVGRVSHLCRRRRPVIRSD
jgi:hypothetical protein